MKKSRAADTDSRPVNRERQEVERKRRYHHHCYCPVIFIVTTIFLPTSTKPTVHTIEYNPSTAIWFHCPRYEKAQSRGAFSTDW